MMWLQQADTTAKHCPVCHSKASSCIGTHVSTQLHLLCPRLLRLLARAILFWAAFPCGPSLCLARSNKTCRQVLQKRVQHSSMECVTETWPDADAVMGCINSIAMQTLDVCLRKRKERETTCCCCPNLPASTLAAPTVYTITPSQCRHSFLGHPCKSPERRQLHCPCGLVSAGTREAPTLSGTPPMCMCVCMNPGGNMTSYGSGGGGK
jgi:hypothetical protein